MSCAANLRAPKNGIFLLLMPWLPPRQAVTSDLVKANVLPLKQLIVRSRCLLDARHVDKKAWHNYDNRYPAQCPPVIATYAVYSVLCFTLREYSMAFKASCSLVSSRYGTTSTRPKCRSVFMLYFLFGSIDSSMYVFFLSQSAAAKL